MQFTTQHGDFSGLYWIPKLHKNPYKENNTKGADSLGTNQLLINIANILAAVKEGIQSYYK
jgi:hypothetical protein